MGKSDDFSSLQLELILRHSGRVYSRPELSSSLPPQWSKACLAHAYLSLMPRGTGRVLCFTFPIRSSLWCVLLPYVLLGFWNGFGVFSPQELWERDYGWKKIQEVLGLLFGGSILQPAWLGSKLCQSGRAEMLLMPWGLGCELLFDCLKVLRKIQGGRGESYPLGVLPQNGEVKSVFLTILVAV